MALINGTTKNDTLTGTSAADTLSGDTGNDTYIFNRGFGQDSVTEYDSTAGNVDTIRFGSGISPADITFSRSGYELVLGVAGTTDQVRIQYWGFNSAYTIERIEFADGTAWDVSTIKTKVAAALFGVPLVGTAGKDNLYAWEGESGAIIRGLDGDDSLMGNSGNDTIDGGTGNDYLYGGTGNDLYLFNRGGGQDRIGELTTGNAAGTVDTLRFGEGISSGDLTYSFSGNDLILGINASTDQVTLIGWGANTESKIELIEFADGTAWDSATLEARVSDAVGATVAGTAGKDTLYGKAGINSNLQGLAGDDILYGNTGNDNLDGGAGNDNLNGGSGNDLLTGGTGNDTMIGGVGNDVYVVDSSSDLVTEKSGEGTDTVKSGITWTLGANLENLILTGATAINGTGNTAANSLTGNSAANSLSGAAGNDILDGGAGADKLTGGTGNDTYKLGRGYGIDTIIENDTTAGNKDIAMFGADIAANQLWFKRASSNLEVTVIGTGDKFVVQNWYSGSQYRVEQFLSGDGKALSSAGIDKMVSAMASLAAPASGQTTMTQEYLGALAPVIDANWLLI